ncbi:FeoA domain-containing protein [Georgenia thermotolerans]|uniref:Ferrous iron transport protein A n=1 Tax=Georgenia thermotolerans TaxID=527326 RepID=A0A7J5UUC5_9MICO|nr:FeoA domain-containing protein [Georgenia thermotolerans]KAE8765876.1 ferrous iron transport protein A [Georgenia thermotolerans]
MRLSRCRECAEVRVVGVAGGAALPPLLHRVGLRPGVRLRVTGRAAFGGVAVAVAGARMVLDAATARRVGVALVPQHVR